MSLKVASCWSSVSLQLVFCEFSVGLWWIPGGSSRVAGVKTPSGIGILPIAPDTQCIKKKILYTKIYLENNKVNMTLVNKVTGNSSYLADQ